MEKTEQKQEGSVAVAEPSAPAAVPAKKEKKPKLKTPKKKRKWLRRLIVVVVLAAVIALLLNRCMQGAKGTISSLYIPAPATYQDMTVSVSGTGTIKPIDSYNATALVKGEVLAAPFQEGDTVAKDDVLFRIDAKTVESSIQQQEIALAQAKVNHDQLLKNQSDAQKNQIVKSNASGVVVKLYVDEGDNVSVGTPIADVRDRDHMKLKVPFHSSETAGFSLGQAASVTVDGTMETIPGTIDDIAPTDSVGPGGTLVREVTILVNNPGAITDTTTGTATVGAVDCAGNATFTYGESKQIVAKATGELVRLSIKEGDKVTDGQVIGSFDDTDMASQIENSRLGIESAELSLKSARDSLEDYVITAPIAGKIIEMNYKAGDNIDPTASSGSNKGSGYLAVIYDMTALKFEMNIDELDINKVKVGQTVEITADALDGKTFTGRVDTVNINGATANGVTTYPVTIMVDDPEELLPGMNVSAKIIVEKAGNVLCVPVDAVERGNIVKVAGEGALDENGSLVDPTKLEDREVVLGRNDSDFIEVVSGLEEGENVYLSTVASNAMSMMMGG